MRGMMERGGEGGMMVGFCVFDVDEMKGRGCWKWVVK